jgi:type I restriction enzyme S subunit
MMFYKETNFKETFIGKIPGDWSIAKLNNLIEIETGKRAEGGALEKGNIASIGGEHIDNEGNVRWDDMKFIPEDFYDSLKQGKVNLGDILLVKDGATTGKVALVKLLKYEKAAVNEHVFIIRSKTRELVNEFLFYFLFSRFGQIQIKTRFHGLIGGIIRGDLETILIPLPQSSEQQTIAEILSTVDEAIQKTNEVIAKTERLKKGLMQELLMEGIGHKEFKDTEIGRIPKEWEVVKLGDDKIAEIRGNKIISDVQKVAFIPMELIPDQGIFVKYEIRSLKDVSSSTYCEAGDLLLAKITPSLENGKQGIVPEDVPNGFALATTEVYPIVCKGIDRLFLFYVLKFPRFRKILEFSMRGTTGRQRVPKDAVERLKIPLPSYQEQKRIAETLSTFDKKLKIEGNEKAKLERIKQGLMDLLLTGKIRVKVN